ncbi:MAG: class I SAM-dependent methyltransferase [Holosporaceae bacterium]|jgi:predicted RNA methylase|nr:class I SAM-dependent methyltransferase [Holosporaceae bacterium]
METTKKFECICGYDNNGTVVDAGDGILRKINKRYFGKTKEIFEFYENFRRNCGDIVETELIEDQESLYHKKHLTTYPFEWPPNMFKDALIFHLELFLKSDAAGYTLKDGLPNNILFNGTIPVFIDFLSFLKTEDLKNEKWLAENSEYNDLRYEVFEKMFIPYFIIPFLVIAKGNYDAGRFMLREKACNMPNGIPSWDDIAFLKTEGTIKKLIKKITGKPTDTEINKDIRAIYQFLRQEKKLSFPEFISKMIAMVRDIDVTPKSSGYLSYYNDKKENFNISDRTGWKNKQINVYNTIQKCKPKTVLDLGANTGWFSLLAESSGASVISIEIDESCVDNLYKYAKQERLNITPLRVAFEEMENKYFGLDYDKNEYPEYKDRDFKNNPLFISASKRLKSDMVMCLALFHHLVLGMGMDQEHVMEVLSELTSDVLILEFIGIDDLLITSEPSFFKNLHKYDSKSYNPDRVVNIGMQFFKNVEILDSHPNTRKLIVFHKQ